MFVFSWVSTVGVEDGRRHTAFSGRLVKVASSSLPGGGSVMDSLWYMCVSSRVITKFVLMIHEQVTDGHGLTRTCRKKEAN